MTIALSSSGINKTERADAFKLRREIYHVVGLYAARETR